jgi:hypothetical protein
MAFKAFFLIEDGGRPLRELASLRDSREFNNRLRSQAPSEWQWSLEAVCFASRITSCG